MVDFAKLKKNRGSKSLDKLTNQLEKMSGPKQGGGKDDRFWYPQRDQSGNGFAVIRFLPAGGDEDMPFVRVFRHAFQGPGGWYIENSLTTIDQPDPCGELNSKLWNDGTDAGKEQARKQKRQMHYIANVLVIQDKNNPENEGKVMLFKFGAKIFDKIKSAMHPEFEDEDAINPFDLWEGANFKLKIRQYEGYPNYDKSEFDSASELFDGDEGKLKELCEKLHELQPFVDPSNFKTYDELKKRLNKVLGLEDDTPATSKKRTVIEKDEDEEMAPAPTQKKASAPKIEADDEIEVDNSDDDDDLVFFREIAKK